MGVAGCNDAPLLSSYWCELCFNDCRDADAKLQFNQIIESYHLFCLMMIFESSPVTEDRLNKNSDSDFVVWPG